MLFLTITNNVDDGITMEITGELNESSETLGNKNQETEASQSSKQIRDSDTSLLND